MFVVIVIVIGDDDGNDCGGGDDYNFLPSCHEERMCGLIVRDRRSHNLALLENPKV